MSHLTLDEMFAIEQAGKTPAAKHRAKTIGVMRKLHGAGVGTCGECSYFRDVPIDGAIGHAFKCRKFGASSSASTDWRKSWPACGVKG